MGVAVKLARLLDAGLEHLERAERESGRGGRRQQIGIGEHDHRGAGCKAKKCSRHPADPDTGLHADLSDLAALLHEHGDRLLAGEQAHRDIVQLIDEVLHLVAGELCRSAHAGHAARADSIQRLIRTAC